MENITVNDITAAAGGRLLKGCGDRKILHLSIDSRSIGEDTLFIPLVGEKNDAHRFLGGAIGLGAAAVLTSRHKTLEDIPDGMERDGAGNPVSWIYVEDTKTALQAIGGYYRSRLTLPLVGVTGSVGKTTSREMIGAALQEGFRVYKTPKNFNSQIGLPLTLSEITGQDEIGVLELGMSEPGEMTVIANLAKVDMAVVTNIGIAHIEQLGSKENICAEKLRIQDGMKDGGILFLNGDDEILKHKTGREGIRTLYYGTGENCDYRAEDISYIDGKPVFTAVHGEEKAFAALNVYGIHNVLNAMAAIGAAHEMGISMEAAARGVAGFTGFAGRQDIYHVDGKTIIDDSYNASPVSMKAGIEVLRTMPAKRRIAVLADMKELGAETRRYHREIGEFLTENPVDLVALYGELAAEIGAALKNTEYRHFSAQEELEDYLKQELKEGDSVLFKGSNSMGLGKVAAHWIKKD